MNLALILHVYITNYHSGAILHQPGGSRRKARWAPSKLQKQWRYSVSNSFNWLTFNTSTDTTSPYRQKGTINDYFLSYVLGTNEKVWDKSKKVTG